LKASNARHQRVGVAQRKIADLVPDHFDPALFRYSVTVVMGQRILANRQGMTSGLMLGFIIGMGGIGAGLLGMLADAWGIAAVMKIIAAMPSWVS